MVSTTKKNTKTKKVVKPAKGYNYNFPKTEAEFNKWFSSFQKSFIGNHKKFNFTPTQMKSFRSAYNSWVRYYKAWQKAYNAQVRAFNKMSSGRQNAEKVMNGFWYRLSNSNFNTGQFSNFGVPAKVSKPSSTKKTKSVSSVASKNGHVSMKRAVKKTTTRKPVQKISYNEFPWVRSDWNSAGKVSVYVTASANGAGKFPTWAKGVALQFRKKGGKWQNLTTTNSWPFVHVIGNAKGNQFEYRAAYTYGNGKLAPWSKTSVAFTKAA